MARRGPLILALDIGTSSCRASLFDSAGQRLRGRHARVVYAPATTPDGGAEMDPHALERAVAATLDAVLARPLSAPVVAVATTTFLHSLMGVDGAGRPTTPLYPWLDGRSRDDAAALREQLDPRAIHARTGCPLHGTYWPARLRWLCRTRPDVWRGTTRWVSFGEYLHTQLLGASASSVSLASASGLFDLRRLVWDADLAAALDVDAARLPGVQPLRDPVGTLRPEYAGRWPALAGVPWLPPVGDGATSSVGAGCVTRERTALMLGTSGAVRVLWRGEAPEVPWGAWCCRLDETRPMLGGAVNDGGNLAAWMRASLRLPDRVRLEADLAAQEPDSHGLSVLPFWGGERAPGWADDARGAIVGLRLHTRPLDILRAAMEGVALRLAALDDLLRRAVPEGRTVVATGGGLLASPTWMQVMADALGRPVQASAEPEGSSRGAALVAAEVLGLLPGGLEALRPRVGATFQPRPWATERYRAAARRQAALYDRLVASPLP